MKPVHFLTADGLRIPALTEDQMREIDRIAVQQFRLGILQMMENAGRNLAEHMMERLQDGGRVVVMAGTGGNGGGGLCCARHLLNRDLAVDLLLTKPPASYSGAAKRQWDALEAAGATPIPLHAAPKALESADIVVDALIGYSLRGAPKGSTADLIRRCNESGRHVVSLDLPSGLDASTGEMPGVVARADEVLTLALPKTGLARVEAELFVADIGIPCAVYQRLGLDLPPFFGPRYRVRIHPEGRGAGGPS